MADDNIYVYIITFSNIYYYLSLYILYILVFKAEDLVSRNLWTPLKQIVNLNNK